MAKGELSLKQRLEAVIATAKVNIAIWEKAAAEGRMSPVPADRLRRRLRDHEMRLAALTTKGSK